MSKRERIEALEERVAALEARPLTVLTVDDMRMSVETANLLDGAS